MDMNRQNIPHAARRKFIGGAVIAPAVLCPAFARADFSSEGQESGSLLFAADVIAMQDSLTLYVQTGGISGSQGFSTPAELIAYLRSTAGDSIADYVNANYFSFVDAIHWGEACGAASALGSTRLSRAGTIALMRYCTGAGWAFMMGWNIGTGIQVIVSSTVSSYFLSKTLDRPPGSN